MKSTSRILFVLFILIISINGLFSIDNYIGVDFGIKFRKSEKTDFYFYDPDSGSADFLETNIFLFERDSEEPSVPASETVGIAWTIYDSISGISVEFRDNYTDQYMLRYKEGESPYNYSVSISGSYSEDFTSPAGISVSSPQSPMTKDQRTIRFDLRNDVTHSYPIIGNAVMTLTLNPIEKGFMAGQYTGQMILTLEGE